MMMMMSIPVVLREGLLEADDDGDVEDRRDGTKGRSDGY